MASGDINTFSVLKKNANNVTSATIDISDTVTGYGAIWFLTGRHYTNTTVYGAIGVFSASNSGAAVLCSEGLTGITASVVQESGSRKLTVSWTNSISYAKLEIVKIAGEQI